MLVQAEANFKLSKQEQALIDAKLHTFQVWIQAQVLRLKTKVKNIQER